MYIGMYKRSSTIIYKGKKFDLIELVRKKYPQAIEEYEGTEYFSLHEICDELITFEIDGYIIKLFYEEDDNYYQYAELTQPDGTVWSGFSGYGVGAGLEDCEYGFSTSDRVKRLKELFPMIIKE
jgi:hypothetical protein